jgi:hypothetical protein
MLMHLNKGIMIQFHNPIKVIVCKKVFARLVGAANRIKLVGGVTVTMGALSEALKLTSRLKSGIEANPFVV